MNKTPIRHAGNTDRWAPSMDESAANERMARTMRVSAAKAKVAAIRRSIPKKAPQHDPRWAALAEAETALAALTGV